jgi:hypothetical protein
MMNMLVAVGAVAVCCVVGLLAYFTHRFICLLQTEVACMKTVAVRQREKAERINRAMEMEGEESVDLAR